MTMRRVPLGWFNLTHDRVRFGLFVAGITFAVVLMFVQLGFRNALLDSNTQLHDRLRADLVMVSPSRQAFAMRETFPRRRLAQAAGVPGVREVHPMYVENVIGFLRDTNANPDDRQPARAIRVYGVDPDAHLLDLPEFDPENPELNQLRPFGTAFFDRKIKRDPERPGQSIFGPLNTNIETELSGRKIQFTGHYDLGSDFTSDGSIVLNDRTFLSILREPHAYGSPSAGVDLGLIRLEPGISLKQAKFDIQRALDTGERDPDCEVFTIEEFKDREKTFWLNNTPIGFAFGFGLAMGLIVGFVICYQILSGDVADHLPEYATMKAMGHTNLDLASSVIQQALILALAGYVLGFLISLGAYEFLAIQTGLPMRFTIERGVWIFLATVVMCVSSSLLALITLFRADPADVF